MRNFANYHVDVRRHTSGVVKTICEQCLPTRHNKRDRSLRVNIDTGHCHCYHCGADFYVPDDTEEREKAERQAARKRRAAAVVPQHFQRPVFDASKTTLSDATERWLVETRCIPQSVIAELRITEQEEFMPQSGQKERCVCFNYFEDGQLVNTKFRSVDAKHFKMVQGAELIPYNIDSVLGFDFTYGAAGLKRIPKFSSVTLVFICVVLSCFFIHTMMKSKHGRAILSIRDNEIASESVGVNTTYYKTMAFVFSAMLAGIAGCLYAGYLGSLYPSTFKFMKSIEILVIVVLGGMGSMLGSIVSATVLTVLPELLRSVADYRMVAYSLALVIMMIFRPKGLFGSYDFSMSRVLEKGLNFVFRPELRSRKEEQNDEQN